jgi:DNA end-binding protein Ku
VRAIWKGHISFGLVSIPVSLFPAEQRADLQLHMLDSRNFSRVRYERVNAETGEEVPWDATVKGYEYEKGHYVVIGKDELEAAAPEATKAVEIEAFVDLEDIDPLYFDKPYYLEPTKQGRKGYALLREAMRESGKAAIATVVIRTRQYLAALTPRGDGLVLNLLRYQQEVRDLNDLDLPGDLKAVGVKPTELKMARDLIASMETDWDPGAYHDEYREQLLDYINKRVEAGELERAPEAAEVDEGDAPAPINLMEALKKSLGGSDGKKTQKKTPKKTKKKTTKKAG